MFLERFRRLFASEIGRFLFGVFFASFGFVALRFILSPVRIKILSTILSKEEYGSLTLISLTISFITLAASLGSLEFLIRKLPGRGEDYQLSCLKTVVVWFGSLALLLAAGGVVVFSLWPSKILNLGFWDWLACGLVLVLTVYMTQLSYYLLGRSQYSLSRVLQLIFADTWFLPIIFLAMFGDVWTGQVLWVWVIWLILTVMIAHRWVPWRRIVAEPASMQTLREVLKFGLPLAPMIFGDWLFRVQDRYVLLAYTNIEVVANYTLCINVAMIGQIVGCSLLDILLTEFFKIRNRIATKSLDVLIANKNLRNGFTLMLRYSLVIIVPIGMVLAMTGLDVLKVLSSPQFYDAAVILPWTVPIPLFYLLSFIFGRVLISLERGRLVGWVTLLLAGVNIGLSLLIVPWGGAKGAALANGISFALLAGYLGWSLKFWRWIEWSELSLVRLGLFVLVCGVGFYGCSQWLQLGSFLVLAVGGLWSLVWILLLGLAKKSDLQRLFGQYSKTPAGDVATN